MKKIIFCIACIGYSLSSNAMVQGLRTLLKPNTRTMVGDLYRTDARLLLAQKEIAALKNEVAGLKAAVHNLQQSRGKLARVARKTRKDLNTVQAEQKKLEENHCKLAEAVIW